MKHITEQYGQPANLLELSSEDFDKLRPFLFQLGVLSRAEGISHRCLTSSSWD